MIYWNDATDRKIIEANFRKHKFQHLKLSLSSDHDIGDFTLCYIASKIPLGPVVYIVAGIVPCDDEDSNIRTYAKTKLEKVALNLEVF